MPPLTSATSTPAAPCPAQVAAPETGWFCIRTQPKHEHIAAASLRKGLGVETFLPRLRLKRATLRGPVWFTEALFPGYLFARFALGTGLQAVRHASGVREVVHFGSRWPMVPEAVIAGLQAALGPTGMHVVIEDFRPGQSVQIAGGVFQGLSAVVTRVMPSQERVAVLMDFLGRQTPVELAWSEVVVVR